MESITVTSGSTIIRIQSARCTLDKALTMQALRMGCQTSICSGMLSFMVSAMMTINDGIWTTGTSVEELALGVP